MQSKKKSDIGASKKKKKTLLSPLFGGISQKRKKNTLSSTFLLFWNFHVWIRQFQLWLISRACCLSAHVVKSKRVHWGAHFMLHHTRPSKLRVFLHQRAAIFCGPWHSETLPLCLLNRRSRGDSTSRPTHWPTTDHWPLTDWPAAAAAKRRGENEMVVGDAERHRGRNFSTSARHTSISIGLHRITTIAIFMKRGRGKKYAQWRRLHSHQNVKAK